MPLFTTPGTAITAGTITATQFSNTVDFGGPKISSILVTNSSYVATGSNTVSTAGGYIKAIGTGFVTGCTVVVNSNIAPSVSFVNSTEVRAQVPATVDGTYMMYLTNPDGGVALRLNAITYLTPETIIDYLVIAGGGGGGYAYGGGGGAGGLLSSTGLTITGSVTLTILVGAGGAPDTNGANSSISGSGISTITAIGGGGGRVNTNSNNGGSGGGASNAMFGSTGNKGLGTAGPPRQGYDGGDGGYYYGGGGGGAGAAGSSSGTGGIGANSSITGSSVTYAGGGGGGAQSRYGGSGSSSGGLGGGGNGGFYDVGLPGQVNTGGGAGGGAATGASSYTSGGTGGSGVVIIRYSSTRPVASSTTGSPTITVTGGYRIYTWSTTGSGSITF